MVPKVLSQHGIRRKVADKAPEIARWQGRFTVFVLTRLAGRRPNTGDGTAADERASSLLALAAPALLAGTMTPLVAGSIAYGDNHCPRKGLDWTALGNRVVETNRRPTTSESSAM